jgi:predicted MFS family arabinose efflux permease
LRDTEEGAAVQRRARGTFAAFAHPGYTALWLNCLCVTLAVVMMITTEFIVVADLAGSNGAVGGVTFALGVPMLLLGPLAGVFADRLSKQLILLACQAAMAVAAFGLGCLVATDLVSVPWLLLVAAVLGTSVSLLGPTQIAYMGKLVPPLAIGNATALFQACLNLTRVLGPFVVAGLVAWKAVGAAGSFFAIAALMLVGTLPLAALPRSDGGAAVVESILEEMMLGVRHVLGRPKLFRLVVSYCCVTLLGFAFFVVLPRFADDVLGAGNSGYGIIVGVSSLGGLAATIFVAPLADSKRAALLLTGSTFVFGLGLVATGLAPTFGVALCTMVVVGVAASAFQALNNAAAFREADAAYLGRVTAIMNIAWSLTNLVGLPVGFVADAVGERWTLVGVGAGLCGLAGLLALWGTAPVPRLDVVGEADA